MSDKVDIDVDAKDLRVCHRALHCGSSAAQSPVPVAKLCSSQVVEGARYHHAEVDLP